MARESDRWVTPDVVRTVIRLGTLVVLAVLVAVVYLIAIGRDPAPLLQAIGGVVAAVTGLGNLGLQLATRATTAKVERNTSVLAPGGIPDRTEPLYGRHGRPPRP